MIKIELVRVGNVLVGRTVSDRWNLQQLIGEATIVDDRNGAALKRLRRAIAKEFGESFALTKLRGRLPVMEATAAETNALGVDNAAKLAAACWNVDMQVKIDVSALGG